MTNKLKGEVSFPAGEDTFVLLFNLDALCGLEETFDMSVAEIGEAMQNKMRLKMLRGVFQAGLAAHHPDISAKAAGEIIDRIGLGRAGALIAEAFSAAFASDTEAGEAAGDPPRAPTV